MSKTILVMGISLAFIAGTLTSGTMAFASGDKNGKPFEAIWAAINALEAAISEMEAIEGPQGEQGPMGPQGEKGDPGESSDMSEYEKRLAALENKAVPQFSVRKVFAEDIVAAHGTQVIHVSCNPDETLIHGGWTGSVGLEPLEIFQTVLKTDKGNDRDTQKIKFGNTKDVNLPGRALATCAKIVP